MNPGINVVGLYVDDQDEALAFYVGKLGMREMMRLDRDDRLWLLYLRITDTQYLEVFPEGVGEVPGAVRRDDGSWLVDGRMGIHEVERTLGVSGMAEGHEFTTLAGFILWQLRRLPKVADGLEWRGYRFEVVDMDGRRIDKVLVVPPADRSA